MIAADTSTWIAFFKGESGRDTDLLDTALRDRQVVMAPVVLTELLSDPHLAEDVLDTLAKIPMLEIETGYWQRAGVLRAKVLSKRQKARLGDALIAQSCLDSRTELITRDRDFRAFASAAGLTVLFN
jgi:predicted nucleic acid-binding protein